MESVIRETQSVRSAIELTDQQSVHDTENLLISLESRLTNRINGEYHRASPLGIGSELERAFDKTLDALQQLLSALNPYKSQTDSHKRSRTTDQSSPTEEKPTVTKSSQPKSRIKDEQSSEASHSSIEDEVLVKVARAAYEQKSKRLK